LVPEEAIARIVAHTEACCGYVSMKRNSDGTESPYELNISYYDIMGRDASDNSVQKRDRFLCSQTIALEMQGVPAVYFHSLVATPNDYEGVEFTGRARSINRHKWELPELLDKLQDPSSRTCQVFNEYVRRLRLRARFAAFHPDAPQEILALGSRVFALQRTAPDGGARMVCISNVTSRTIAIRPASRVPALRGAGDVQDVLSETVHANIASAGLKLAPYQTAWLHVTSADAPESRNPPGPA
jgi:sucrose phosphorylase